MDGETKMNSVFAPYIEGYLRQKRAMGFKYETEELILARFDRYCASRGCREIAIDKDFLEEFLSRSDNEKIGNVNKRARAVAGLARYMIPLGFDLYVPAATGRSDVVLPHLFTDEELKDFFSEVDNAAPACGSAVAFRMLNEYKVLFRLYACTGIRNSEGGQLRTSCVNLDEGILEILDSKGHKDRLVYMPDDLAEMCRRYFDALVKETGFAPAYFFPGSDLSRGIPSSTVDMVFNRYWARTRHSGCCNNKPTVHDFRFTFITRRINGWARRKMPASQLLAYLSAYCGHKNMAETYYYYHMYQDMHGIIEEHDATGSLVMPEARKYG